MNLNRSVNIDAKRFFNKKDVTEYLFFNMCKFKTIVVILSISNLLKIIFYA